MIMPSIVVETDFKPNASVTSAPDEMNWVHRAQRGDTEAFDRLCRLHGDRLMRQATLLCGDRSEAQDLVQETLVSAWKSIDRFNGRCQVFTWLCSILAHRHGDGLRRKAPTAWSRLFGTQREKVEEYLKAVPDPHPVPAASLEQSELVQHVMQNLLRLPEKQRVVVYLRFFADESLEGIAEALACSLGTVKSRLFHGLERLRLMSALKEKGRE